MFNSKLDDELHKRFGFMHVQGSMILKGFPCPNDNDIEAIVMTSNRPSIQTGCIVGVSYIATVTGKKMKSVV